MTVKRESRAEISACVGRRTENHALTGRKGGSNFFPRNNLGQVAEWLKAHAWKVCIRLKPYRGFESLPVRCRREK